MKRLLFIVVAIVGCLASLFAVDYQPYRPSQAQMQGYDANALNVQAPDYRFTGTSSMQTGSYTVPVAVLSADGASVTEETSVVKPGVRKIGVRPSDDERTDPESPEPPSPIGDAPWLLMALMALAYAALRVRKIRKV